MEGDGRRWTAMEGDGRRGTVHGRRGKVQCGRSVEGEGRFGRPCACLEERRVGQEAQAREGESLQREIRRRGQSQRESRGRFAMGDSRGEIREGRFERGDCRELHLQLVAISGNQWQSVASLQRAPPAISGNQWQSVAISGNQWRACRKLHLQSVAISGNQW